MAKLLGALRRNVRTVVQLCWTALTNGYAAGFAKGTIYKGELKRVCVPGLNCYSCPGALGACPIGSLQAVLGDRNHWFSFYVVGFLLFFGAVLGRFVCGWLCPFGLAQDLLAKIPFPKKRKGQIRCPHCGKCCRLEPGAAIDAGLDLQLEGRHTGRLAAALRGGVPAVLPLSLPAGRDLRAL